MPTLRIRRAGALIALQQRPGGEDPPLGPAGQHGLGIRPVRGDCGSGMTAHRATPVTARKDDAPAHIRRP
jgi:hypothetical protein